MAIIGIITNLNNIMELENKIKKSNISEKNIIIINEESIENIKNVKFDILIISEEAKGNDKLKQIINSCKYLIINTDFKENIKLIDEQIDGYVITFGFNSKATITIVSNENEEIILEVQREIENIYKEKIECQEIKMKNNYGKNQIYLEISMKILTFLAKHKVFM